MVAIKDIEMPNNCSECGLKSGSYCYFKKPPYNFNGINILNERASDCPLVEIEERKVVKCTDCNEYNHEKHYCPKFCDVIRDTTKEMQDFYKGEHEKIERIEQIYRQWSEIGDNADSWAFSEIGEVLEKE